MRSFQRFVVSDKFAFLARWNPLRSVISMFSRTRTPQPCLPSALGRMRTGRTRSWSTEKLQERVRSITKALYPDEDEDERRSEKGMELFEFIRKMDAVEREQQKGRA